MIGDERCDDEQPAEHEHHADGARAALPNLRGDLAAALLVFAVARLTALRHDREQLGVLLDRQNGDAVAPVSARLVDAHVVRLGLGLRLRLRFCLGFRFRFGFGLRLGFRLGFRFGFRFGLPEELLDQLGHGLLPLRRGGALGAVAHEDQPGGFLRAEGPRRRQRHFLRFPGGLLRRLGRRPAGIEDIEQHPLGLVQLALLFLEERGALLGVKILVFQTALEHQRERPGRLIALLPPKAGGRLHDLLEARAAAGGRFEFGAVHAAELRKGALALHRELPAAQTVPEQQTERIDVALRAALAVPIELGRDELQLLIVPAAALSGPDPEAAVLVPADILRVDPAPIGMPLRLVADRAAERDHELAERLAIQRGDPGAQRLIRFPLMFHPLSLRFGYRNRRGSCAWYGIM